ncbi:9810_t:CDS:2 [Acaulospora morrowiae]|uniref:non-specific serine/threonine protein kinase n=1 Tax=Acaulospora morrowiae TaxID=94023 RepID=A0A9N9G7T3_9GLOM|nr:9810_t:CDS:2 [Acaulospora morrowiae]
MDNNIIEKIEGDEKQPEATATDGSEQNKEPIVNKQQASNVTQQKEAKSTGNILQATIQKMFNLDPSDKSRSAKGSKDQSASCSENEDERLDRADIKRIPENRQSQVYGARTAQNRLSNNPNAPKPRFQRNQNGSHVHYLQPCKKLHRMHNILKGVGIPAEKSLQEYNNTNVANEKPQMKHSHSEVSLSEKYGKPQEIIGKGAFGVVRIAHKTEPKVPGEKLFAVKEFKRRSNEPPKKYIKRLTSEFCISSSLHHINVIDTIDLLQDTQGNYCEVMEYCAGGDLYSLIASHEKLEQEEADCFFGQLINGVKYLHDSGVAHRDLKPENLLLTLSGCLKITDFGNGECFRMAWETKAHMSRGVCGSEPYIAPEEFTQDWFDPRLVDIWACGIIYMGMITGRHLWRVAKENEDNNFKVYIEARAHGEYLAPFQKLTNGRRRVMTNIIEPNPKKRITTEQIIEDQWFSRINICYKSPTLNHNLSKNMSCGANCNQNQRTMRKTTIANVV